MYSDNSNDHRIFWQHVVRSKIFSIIQEIKGHKVDLTERNYGFETIWSYLVNIFCSVEAFVHYLTSYNVNQISFETSSSCDWESTWRKQAKDWRVGQIHPRPAVFPLRYCVTTQNTYTRTINRIAMQLDPRLCLMNNLANRPSTGYSCGYSTDILWMGLLVWNSCIT